MLRARRPLGKRLSRHLKDTDRQRDLDARDLEQREQRRHVPLSRHTDRGHELLGGDKGYRRDRTVMGSDPRRVRDAELAQPRSTKYDEIGVMHPSSTVTRAGPAMSVSELCDSSTPPF